MFFCLKHQLYYSVYSDAVCCIYSIIVDLECISSNLDSIPLFDHVQVLL